MTVKTHYKLKESFIVKIIFNMTEKINKTPKFFDQTWDTLRKPYDVKFETVMDSQDSINNQIADFFMLSSKINAADETYAALLKTLPDVPENNTFDKSIIIGIDSGFLTQKLKNIKLTAAQVEVKMNTVSLEALKADKPGLATFLSTFENLNSDSEMLIAQIDRLYTTIHLTQQRVMSEHLMHHLLSINDKNDISIMDYQFISTYKEDTKPIAMIQLNYLRNPITYNELIPIPYKHKSLDNTYIINHSTQRIEYLFTPEQIISGETITNPTCLEILNVNLLDNSKISEVIHNCNFVDNYKQYYITKNGIFLFDVNIENIKSINHNLTLKLNHSHQPFLINFDGNITIDTDLFGSIELSKTSTAFINYSSLTLDDISSIDYIDIDVDITQEPFNIQNLEKFVMLNYPIILTSQTATIILFLFFVGLTLLFKKCNKTKYETLQKMFQSRAEKKHKPKPKNVYKITQF